MLNEYVDHILVFEAEKINHRRKQRVEVHLNFIWQFNVPIDGEPSEEAARREHPREYQRNYQRGGKRKNVSKRIPQ